MKESKLLDFAIWFVVFLIIVILVVYSIYLVGNQMGVQYVQSMMEVNCCDGMMCSDTSYTWEDNTCHLVLCEQKAWLGMSNCTYPGKNITINLSASVN